MRTQLWSLTFGNFAIGTGVLIMPGLLEELSSGLSRTPAQIGMLVSAFALVVCVTGPLLAGWTSAIDRRRLLTAALVLYAITHLLSALVPSYAGLLALRMVTAFGAAVFTSQAAATAGLLVPPAQRGRAIGLALLGWSIASVLGMPIGSYLGSHIGWRATMAAEGMLSAAGAVWIWLQIPRGLFVAPMDGDGWKRLFANRPLLLVLAVTALQGAGQFALFAYLVVVWKEFIAASPLTISLLFGCFGITGVLGNLAGAHYMDRIGTERVAMTALALVALALLLWPLSRGSLPITLVLTLLWGLGCFVINSAQQARLISLAPTLASASVAMNSSAMYLGQALGTMAGGLLLSTAGSAHLSTIGALLLACAMLASQLAAGMRARGTAAEPA